MASFSSCSPCSTFPFPFFFSPVTVSADLGACSLLLFGRGCVYSTEPEFRDHQEAGVSKSTGSGSLHVPVCKGRVSLRRNSPKRCRLKDKKNLFSFSPPSDHQQSSSAVCCDHIKGLPFVSQQRECGKSEHPTFESVFKMLGKEVMLPGWYLYSNFGEKNSMLTNQSLLHCTKSISISCVAFIHLSLSWWRPFTWFSDLCLYCLMWRTIKYRVFGSVPGTLMALSSQTKKERERAWRLWAEEADVSLHCWQTHYR